MSALPPIVQEILADKKQIIAACERLGAELNAFYKDNKKPVIFVGILKGCHPFMAYLLNYVNFLCEIEYIEVQSFLGNSQAMQDPIISYDMISTNLKGRDIVLVDDIVDTTASIQAAKNYIRRLKPNSIRAVALVTRKNHKPAMAICDWIGMQLPDDFIIGFGLDYMGCYRNLNYIASANMDYIAKSQQPNTALMYKDKQQF